MWLNNGIPDSFVCPKDYVVYRHARCSVGGDVAVFIKYVICSVAVDIPAEYRHVEVVCVDLAFLNAECRVICVYQKPGFSCHRSQLYA